MAKSLARHDAPAPSKALNAGLWVAQSLLFVMFGMAGFMKATAPIEELAKNMTWVVRFSPEFVRFVGLSELSGAIGLILPAVTRIKPMLTPLAALGIAVIMVLAAGHHLLNGEAPFAPVNLALGGVAAFVAWGRFRKAPILPR
jgi:uncharacterized membrane protein YphA (DoxX/SURF4 family)